MSAHRWHRWPGLPTQITIKSGPDGHETWAGYPVAHPDECPVGQIPSYVRQTGLALVEVWEIDETAVPKGDPPDA